MVDEYAQRRTAENSKKWFEYVPILGRLVNMCYDVGNIDKETKDKSLEIIERMQRERNNPVYHR